MSVDEHALMYMSVDAARTTKWNTGKQAHRPGSSNYEFIGNPVECLHAEGIDALNYLDEVRKQGLALGTEIAELYHHANAIVQMTRTIHGRTHSRAVARERMKWETKIYKAAEEVGIGYEGMSAERTLECMIGYILSSIPDPEV